MNIRAAATSVFVFILLAMASGLISANVRKLADKHGWDNFLVRCTEKLRWERLRGLWWLWSIFGLSGGVALTLWLTPLIVGGRGLENVEVAGLREDLDAALRRVASLEAALQSRATSPAPSVAISPPSPNMTQEARATNLEIWHSVNDECVKGLINTYNELDSVLNDWPLKIKTNKGAFVASMINATSGLKSGDECLDNLLSEYHDYPDISTVLSQPYTASTQKAIEAFAGAIHNLSPTLPANYESSLRPYAGKVSIEATNLVNWIGDTQRIAGLKIKELSGLR
jgi:hypothetical protein